MVVPQDAAKPLSAAELADVTAIGDAQVLWTASPVSPVGHQTLPDGLAADEAAFETSAAGATAAYQTAMAQAAHDHTVATAQAVDAYAHDGDGASYNAALVSAGAALITNQNTAALNDRNALGPATATQETDDANALFAEVTAILAADLSDSQAIDLQNDIATKAESDDYSAEQKADATAVGALATSNADGYSAAVASFDQAYPSPWADQAAAQATAEDARDDALASAELAENQSLADAQITLEKSQADAWQSKYDADAQAAHDKILADAQALHAQSLADANSITSLVAADAYFATLPDVLPAFDWSTISNPALPADYSDVFAVDDVEILDGSSVGSGFGAVSSGSTDAAATPPGQSWVLGATKSNINDLIVEADGMQPLLYDNAPYDPPNPWSASQFMTGVETPPGGGAAGGSGPMGGLYLMPVAGPGSPPQTGGPAAPPGPTTAPMPETLPQTSEETDDAELVNDVRAPGSIADAWRMNQINAEIDQAWQRAINGELPQPPAAASPARSSGASEQSVRSKETVDDRQRHVGILFYSKDELTDMGVHSHSMTMWNLHRFHYSVPDIESGLGLTRGEYHTEEEVVRAADGTKVTILVVYNDKTGERWFGVPEEERLWKDGEPTDQKVIAGYSFYNTWGDVEYNLTGGERLKALSKLAGFYGLGGTVTSARALEAVEKLIANAATKVLPASKALNTTALT
ncbi:MAG TPA: hypothetical protein VFW87_06640 [Pirellulales bacterium]|nr:hypothetical protein [Pirellulales bacterium]